MMAASVASSRGLMTRDMFLILSHWSRNGCNSERSELECGLLYSQTESSCREADSALGRCVTKTEAH